MWNSFFLFTFFFFFYTQVQHEVSDKLLISFSFLSIWQFGFYNPTGLLHSFWANLIFRWGKMGYNWENHLISRKQNLACFTWPSLAWTHTVTVVWWWVILPFRALRIRVFNHSAMRHSLNMTCAFWSTTRLCTGHLQPLLAFGSHIPGSKPTQYDCMNFFRAASCVMKISYSFILWFGLNIKNF